MQAPIVSANMLHLRDGPCLPASPRTQDARLYGRDAIVVLTFNKLHSDKNVLPSVAIISQLWRLSAQKLS